MVRLYNFDYDLFIIEQLFQNEKLGYIDIQRAVEAKIKKKISDDTFDYHIKKLLASEYIKLTIIEGKRGKNKSYRLTDKTKQDIQFGLLDVNYDLTPNSFITKSGQNKNAIAYFITLCSIAKSEIALFVDDENFEYGLSARDISMYYGGFYGFGYQRIKEKNIQKILQLLCGQGLLQKNIDSNNTIRYKISNHELGNFIVDLTTMYNCAIFPRLVLTWQHIRYPKPYERAFFEIHYGKKQASERFNHFKDLLNLNKQKETFKKDLVAWNQRIDNFDYEIKRLIDELSKKYSNLIEKFPTITRILLEIFYPFFLRDLIKDIENKNKYKKYLKLLMIDTNSITKSQDQTRVEVLNKRRLKGDF